MQSVYETDPMPTALNCPLASLAPKLQARTQYHHTVFGLRRYVLSPASLPVARHPLDFAFLLGLSNKCAWYPREQANSYHCDRAASMTLLGELAARWDRSIYDIDTLMLATRLRLFPVELQRTLVHEVLLQVRLSLNTTMSFQHSERFIVMKDVTAATVPKEVLDRLMMNLAELQAALLAKDPMMPQHLRSSHAILVSYPETVHLLDDQEVASLIDAAEIHTKTEIIKSVAAGKGATKKKITVNDL